MSKVIDDQEKVNVQTTFTQQLQTQLSLIRLKRPKELII